jgi:hypothetical protein
MNAHRDRWFRVLVVASLAFSGFGLGASAATDKKQPAPIATSPSKAHKAGPVEVPKSVFNAMEGRNPFFPAASVQPINPGLTGGKVQPPPKPTPITQLVLNGMVPPAKGAEKPTAMINGHTFEQGETAEVKLQNGTKLQIKCEEIRMESVIISIDGSKSELKMRFGA